MVDLGQPGHYSDVGTLSNSTFGKAMERDTLPLPSPRPLPGTTQPDLLYVIVEDKAIPLRKKLLRPYPGKNLSGILLIHIKIKL